MFMPRKTKVDTKIATTTNTKLLVATLAVLIAGGLAFASLPISSQKKSFTTIIQPPIQYTTTSCAPTKVTLLGEKATESGNTVYTGITISCDEMSEEKTITVDNPQTAQDLTLFANNYCQNQCPTEKPQEKQLVCEDSDSGRDYQTPGKIVANGISIPDHCISDTLLQEQYCKNNAGEINQKQCTCLENEEGLGYCTPEEDSIPSKNAFTCIDTDEGKNTDVYGEITWIDIDGEPQTLTDRCYSGTIVQEGVCAEETKQVNIRCEEGTGCYNGACLTEEEITQQEQELRIENDTQQTSSTPAQ